MGRTHCHNKENVASVTYYMELDNAINIHYTSQFFANKGQIGCLDMTEH